VRESLYMEHSISVDARSIPMLASLHSHRPVEKDSRDSGAKINSSCGRCGVYRLG
jgi:hypothetical protein